MTIGEQRAKAILHRHDIMTFGLNCSIYSVADAISKLEDQLQAAQQRITESEQVAQGVNPDWRKAPTWAQYWAIDADGVAYWYETEPHAKGAMGYWGKGDGEVEIDPVRRSFDWLETLCRRQP